MYKKLQRVIIYVCLALFSVRCAQITPLTGGKKDVSPPIPVSYTPQNASLNFNSKTIEINFNEYITLKDVANQFIITPQCKENPEIIAQGKSLKISFSETLLPNTTYKLAFGNAICDLNESNVLQNFEYVFSTGAILDSFKLSGKIIDAVSKQPSSNILVGLYNSESADSIIYKEKPLYISRTNSIGEFRFNYLPNTAFIIIGIEDKNKNLLYDGSDEKIAFTKEKIVPADTSSKISLLLFNETPFKSFIKKSFSGEYGKALIIYNKPQSKIKNLSANGLVGYKQNSIRDSVTIYYTDINDTLKAIIDFESKKSDTLNINIPSEEAFNKQIKNAGIKYILQPNFNSILPYFSSPIFGLNFPVNQNNILSDKVILIEKSDSTSRTIPFKVLKDSSWLTSIKIQADIKPETNYVLTLNKGFIYDNSYRKNDSVTFQFKTTALDDYAQLKMKLLFPKKENYIVRLFNDKDQLINERSVEFSLTSSAEKTMEYNNLVPGNYFIKVVEDANKNGLFDMGDYFLGIQPEVIFINSSPIKLLSGWEIENEWIVK